MGLDFGGDMGLDFGGDREPPYRVATEKALTDILGCFSVRVYLSRNRRKRPREPSDRVDLI
jgi:hypothetical protein